MNGVPIAMFFATHFYFCFYHTLSNMALHKVRPTALFCDPTYIVLFSLFDAWEILKRFCSFALARFGLAM